MSNDFKKFANSFQAIARLQLDGIRSLLMHLGNPQNDLKFIHIAGTNGKGSVCSFMQNILTHAGFKTGKYTSPNLISVCERISVDGILISEADLSQLLDRVEKSAEIVQLEQGSLPTQFEIWTAAAFCYFKEQHCDFVVLETGLGGTRDATNIIPPPQVTVITQLGLDHTEYLGDTLEQIAKEKAGIIKAHKNHESKGITITVNQPKEAMAVLEVECERKSNKLIVAQSPENLRSNGFYEVFDYTSSDGFCSLSDVLCGISGLYQPSNASLAIEAALSLDIGAEHIKEGIRLAKNPARFEIISENPMVIYDGAHNKNGIDALISSLKHYFPTWKGATFIVAFMGDKDIYGSLSRLKESRLLENSEIYAVKVKDNPRAAETEDILKIAARLSIKCTPYAEISLAYADALRMGRPVIICGSLYLYKDFFEIKDNLK